MDNCADLHVDLMKCMRDGSFTERITMCHQIRQTFWECVKRQQEILLELDYGKYTNTPEKDQLIAEEADWRGRQERQSSTNTLI
jgi:hypothetical protein